jgi:hypothetical protein
MSMAGRSHLNTDRGQPRRSPNGCPIIQSSKAASDANDSYSPLTPAGGFAVKRQRLAEKRD